MACLAAVLLVLSGADPFTEALCQGIRGVTGGDVCHVALHVRGTGCGRACPIADDAGCVVEDGFSGLPDLLSGEVRLGAQTTPAKRRLQDIGPWRAVELGALRDIEDAFEPLENSTYSFDPWNIAKLLERAYVSWPQELVCSTFLAKLLARAGCLPEDARAFNALPSDFEHFSYTCGGLMS